MLRIRDAGDSGAWTEFVGLYAPLIHGYAIRRGLQDADAADLAQEVLRNVARAIPSFSYDPAAGKFRGWLFQITRNQVFRKLRQNARVPTATGDTGFSQSLAEQTDSSSEEEQRWDREHEQHVFRWAAEATKPEFKSDTWQAFWRVAVDGEPPASVAESLQMSIGAVYVAKSRVTARLREVINAVDQL
ncbi:MAG: sigma-70 family RNA polymerase sigma factor [Planctomycetota bacterium]